MPGLLDQLLQRHQLDFDLLACIERLLPDPFRIQRQETVQRIGLQGRVWIQPCNLLKEGDEVIVGMAEPGAAAKKAGGLPGPRPF